jgi:DegV family protein with EDD domain
VIAVVTDSASMLPAPLRDRYGITVVPITITLDGHDHAEGVDLGTEEFYARLAQGATVATAAPSPGRFAQAYGAATAAGATEILSVHTGSVYSATVTSAVVAAGLVDVPVSIVDTEVASFPVALAVWSAAEAVRAGGSLDEAAAIARSTAQRAGSLFVVGVPEVARRGGRFVTITGELTPTTVLHLASGRLDEHATVRHLDEAIEVMVEGTRQHASQGAIRVGVGHALRPTLATAISSRVRGLPGVAEVVIYEVGPSVGAHTGPGTLGVVYAPLAG